MSDQPPKPNRPLSEISHLFLSSVRDRQTDGTPRPQRIPPRLRHAAGGDAQHAPHPASRDVSIDLTPEEYAQVFGGEVEDQTVCRARAVSALVTSHLNGKGFDRAKEYARHLAARAGRVGLIELDAAEFRLMCFDPSGAPPVPATDHAAESYDPRQMVEAIEELNYDVRHWLLVLPNPRTVEARSLLRAIDHWVLLSTCDHDGVVSGYRALKGLADLHRPRLSLAILDARNDVEADRIHRKLCGVCEQFLAWPIDAEPHVAPAHNVTEHLVMCCRPTRDKAQVASAPQWRIVADFLERLKADIEEARANTEAHGLLSVGVDDASAPSSAPDESMQPDAPQLVADLVIPTNAPEPSYPLGAPTMPDPTFPQHSAAPITNSASHDNHNDDVLDLAGDEATESSILTAVLARGAAEMIACPLRPPACPAARLAVDRNRCLVMLAVATQGLNDLRSIGHAYRWMCENRALIAMA
ncbi:MAG: hypothetical protein ACREIT_07685, partial [Tepidisphaeraceae bacterium]